MPKEIETQFIPRTREAIYGYLIEECGEVLSAAGKTLRHGERNFNPDVPDEQQELNIDWLLRELDDVERAASLMRAYISDYKKLYALP